MKQIVEQLKSHVAAGYQPMPRGDAPPDDTLAQALAEIEQSKCQGGTASPYGIMKRPVRTLEKTRRVPSFVSGSLYLASTSGLTSHTSCARLPLDLNGIDWWRSMPEPTALRSSRDLVASPPLKGIAATSC